MSGGRKRAATAAVLAALGSAAVATTAEAAPPARATGVTCSFAPDEHELTVRVSDLQVVARIQRRGQELVLRRNRAQVACGPVAPTVSTVDSISVFSNSELAVDLRNGPLAPGFTDEGDGSSEIEIDARFGRAGGLRVRGSARADAIAMGELRGTHAVNLNSREADRDADVTVAGGYNALSVLGRRGNDRISARGGPEFKRALDTKVTVSAGVGRDRVKGAGGRDLLGGGAGPDRISPGAGRDRIRSQAGADRLRVRDGEKDFVQCGPGRDRIAADRIDRLAGCDLR